MALALADPLAPTPTLIARLRAEEGAAALITAVRWALLRDLRAGKLLGAGSLDALRRRELPALDAASARTLGRIADELVPLADETGGAEALAALGLTRLAVAATAPAAVRADLVWAGVVPLTEMRRHARERREAIEAAALRDDRHRSLDPTAAAAIGDARAILGDDLLETLAGASEADRIEAARAALAEVRRGWERVGRLLWTVGASIAELDPGDPVDVEVLASFDIDRGEWERLAGPVRLFGPAGPERLTRLGIGTLRAIAALEDRALAASLVERSADPAITTDELAALAERRTAPLVPTAFVAPASDRRDDPDALCPFDLWLTDDETKGPRFADALPVSLLEQLLLRTTRPGELVWDPFAGSGASVVAAERTGRRIVASDLIDPPVDPRVGVADALEAPAPAGVSAVLAHLPVPLEVVFSERYGGRRRAPDLSGMDPAGYRRAIAAFIARLGRELPAGTAFVIVARPSRFDGRFWDWPRIAAGLAEEAGFLVIDRISAPMGPALRAEFERRGGLRARKRGETLPVVWEAIIARAGGR